MQSPRHLEVVFLGHGLWWCSTVWRPRTLPWPKAANGFRSLLQTLVFIKAIKAKGAAETREDRLRTDGNLPAVCCRHAWCQGTLDARGVIRDSRGQSVNYPLRGAELGNDKWMKRFEREMIRKSLASDADGEVTAAQAAAKLAVVLEMLDNVALPLPPATKLRGALVNTSFLLLQQYNCSP
ncbi:hypothetical protein FGB62_181g012 [Gracilaria domingensis]|nr:hypothetical protein FGB62_181g012 [Gracilaria domingensis]